MLITLYFRNKSNEHEFVMAEGVRFRQQVKVTTQVDQEDTRFGIDQKHIANFVEKCFQTQIIEISPHTGKVSTYLDYVVY